MKMKNYLNKLFSYKKKMKICSKNWLKRYIKFKMIKVDFNLSLYRLMKIKFLIKTQNLIYHLIAACKKDNKK